MRESHRADRGPKRSGRHSPAIVMVGLRLAVAVSSVGVLSSVGAGRELTVVQDWRSYPSVTAGTDSGLDWASFYEETTARTDAVRRALPHVLDVAYGPLPKQRLDVYRPFASATNRPAFVFLHGGGFREGDRRHYGFIAEPLAARGVVTVVPSYRLGPAYTYPAQPDDVKAAIEWTYRHAVDYGIDRSRIFVGGHSAGAVLAAFVSVEREWLTARRLPRDLIKGCAAVSGPYDLRVQIRDHYVADPREREDASPLARIEGRPPSMILAVGSPERDYLAVTEAFAAALRDHQGDVTSLVLEGLTHDNTARAFADPSGRLFQAIVKMIGS
ncbi:MAG: alpha/beta hydrolase [Vicinamibacterales bacterium]